MNKRIHFFIKIYIYIYIYHTLFSKGLMFLWCVRDGWRDIYSVRWLPLPISSSRNQGVPTLPPSCKIVGDASGRLRAPRSTAILCTLSKCHCIDLLPLHTCSTWVPDHSVLFTNQNVTACKAHGVTRNEPKFHGICYITKVSMRYSLW